MGMTMDNEYVLRLERQLSDAHTRIREMIREIDRRDELIADLQRRIAELEQELAARTSSTF
jgi:peptidoglycan hydrolase CwlO-like protein